MRIAIVAGEASGDQLGADLMKHLRADYGGVGGYMMRAQGLNSLFPMDELSVMGVAEVLPKAHHLLKRVKQTATFVIEGNFDALITIDSPDFSHRVAKKVKAVKPNFPVIHYVAPSVWAWREGRARKMARYVDHVLCLLPFEPPFMEEAGMSADFVGHPISRQKPPEKLESWKKNNPQTLGLFPGSRRSEISNHINIYKDFVKALDEDQAVLLTTLDFLYDHLNQSLQRIDNIKIISPSYPGDLNFEDEKQCLIYGADFAVCTSGTISFELAWAGTNCIVGYRTHPLNEALYKRMVKTPYASLANILLGEEAIPEYLFQDFTSENLLEGYNHFQTREEEREIQREKFSEMRRMMIPDIDAAQSVLQFLQKR